MSDEIIGLRQWLVTPAGRYLLAWEQNRFDEAVADIFGYHALQLGFAALDGLRNSRMAHRWLAVDEASSDGTEGSNQSSFSAPAAELPPHLQPPPQPALVTDFHALPFAAQSLDLVLLPHTLELSPNPHATLREVERVLMPEGSVVISGLNPVSLWGLKQRRGRIAARMGVGRLYLPDPIDFIGYLRLRDWLRLLSFEVEVMHFGCWRPAVRSQRWLDRLAWMDGIGERCWPIFGSAYFLVATKRVPNMRKLDAGWKTRAPARSTTAPISVAGRAHRLCAGTIKHR